MASRRVLIRRVRQIWPPVCADFLGMWAAWVQMASGRWGEWAGRIARQDAASLARTRRQRRYGRQQGLRIGMARLGEEPLGGRAFDDAAEIHDGNARRDMLHHRQIVADEDVSEAKSLLQILKQVQDLTADRDVEGGHRLVADDQLRLHRQCTGDGNALALAAREFVRIALDMLGLEPDDAQQIANTLAPARG